MKETRIEGEPLKTLLKSFPRRMESLPKSRLIVIGDIGLDDIGVVALRAQHRDGVLAGFAGAAAGFEPGLWGVLALADGADDALTQVVVLDALHGGFGLVRQRGRRRELDG